MHLHAQTCNALLLIAVTHTRLRTHDTSACAYPTIPQTTAKRQHQFFAYSSRVKVEMKHQADYLRRVMSPNVSPTTLAQLVSLVVTVLMIFNLQTISLPIVVHTAANTSTPEPVPTSATPWSQDGGNAQRTGYTPEEPAKPWDFVWSWNGADANMRDTCGGSPEKGHCYNAPREARTIVGDNKVFAPAGKSGLYAIHLTNGKQAWRTNGVFNATPAYADGFVYIGRNDGAVLKIKSGDGTIAGQYNAGSAVNLATLVNSGFVYAISDNGTLHKIATNNMTAVWTYDAGSRAAISMAFSAKQKLVIYATEDLFVHAVNESDGSRRWRVKPSMHTPGFDYKFSWGWPVIADVNGIVLLRMRMDRQAVYGARHPETLRELREWYDCAQHPTTCKREWENLFALNLNDGQRAFYTLVGYGSVEYWDAAEENFSTDQGGLPVVKTLADGKQVAYVQWRTGTRQNKVTPGSNDGRGDSELGEMLLDGSTVSGYRAGDIRWVSLGNQRPNSEWYERTFAWISDEQSPLSMAGNTLFYSHWGAMESFRITNRNANLGSAYNTPIKTEVNAPVVRDAACPSQVNNTAERFCATDVFLNANVPGSYLGRNWVGAGGGWYTYLDILSAPGSPFKSSYSGGPLPRYTYVSNGYVVVSGNGGDLMVFRHSGR
jgi:outer membrane protein assembly factor BamB